MKAENESNQDVIYVVEDSNGGRGKREERSQFIFAARLPAGESVEIICEPNGIHTDYLLHRFCFDVSQPPWSVILPSDEPVTYRPDS